MSKHKGEGEFPFKILEDEIPIFRAGGRYPQAVTDLNPQGLISQDMIDDLAASYNADAMLSPITVDHVQHGEAKGRIGSLLVKGNTLFMKVKSVVKEFRDDLKDGKYLYPSVEIYEPRDHANPSPGRWYLKAVTFLGAAAPAVKGLYAGFKERWVISDGAGRVLCFCSELNNIGEVDMKPEEIQKMIDDSLKANSKVLLDSLGESMKTQFSEFAKTLPKPKEADPKPADKNVNFAEELGKEKLAREAAQKRLEALEKKNSDAEKAALDLTATAFKETLLTEARMTPADIKEKIEPRVVHFVESNDMASLVAFRDSILSTTKKDTIFKEIAPDLKKTAEQAGVTLGQETRLRGFAEDHGKESATPENIAMTRDGIAKYNEEVKKGKAPDHFTMLNAMCDAQRETLAKEAV